MLEVPSPFNPGEETLRTILLSSPSNICSYVCRSYPNHWNVIRFHRLAWGHAAGLRSRGVIAAGMENAELDVWDPIKILSGQG
jgi:hypothetical protein